MANFPERNSIAFLLLVLLPSYDSESLDSNLLPEPSFGLRKLHFQGYGQASKPGEFLEAHFSNPLGIRVFRSGRWTKENCADEYVGFRYVSKKNLGSFFSDYRVCEYPFDNQGVNTDNFEIEPRRVCTEDKSQWIRLDCRFTDKASRNSPPFYASRMSQKPGMLRSGGSKFSDFMGHTASGNHFNERIRCDKENHSNEIEECRALLSKFVMLEKAMCDADNCAAKPKPEEEKKLAPEGTNPEAPAAEGDEKKEGAAEEPGMSPLTIGLIAGGGVLALGIGVAVMKYMGGSKAAADAAEGTMNSTDHGKNGRRTGRSRRKHNSASANGSSNEGLLDNNAPDEDVGEGDVDVQPNDDTEQA